MKFIVIFITLATVHCRPQNLQQDDILEKEKREQSTRDILEKIAEVNKSHGLVPAKKKQSYFHFPFSYKRQVSEPERQLSEFKNRSVLNEDSDDYYVDGEEEEVPEQQITKKVTHVQTFGVPMNMPMSQPMNMPMSQPMMQPYSHPMMQSYLHQEPPPPTEITNEVDFKKVLDRTEQLPVKKTTIVKHEVFPIASNQQFNPTNLFNPYQSESTPRQNWNWPGAQYFPIVIRDPFIQMYQAITTMIEYGPGVGMAGGNSCKGKVKDARAPKQDENAILDIEGIHISSSEIRGGRSRENKIDYGFEQPTKRNIPLEEQISKRNELFNIGKPNNTLSLKLLPRNDSVDSPPDRDVDLQDDELSDEESEKSDDITVSNENAKKVFSKDNTGNGIFIHRLKVRKGGVAIAGPGGIATAGSGGTAIVGPNGFAYTHPDSLAIAGSGSKVIALDPQIDLLDALNNHKNKTTRMGKVVATGPVIYYNKG